MSDLVDSCKILHPGDHRTDRALAMNLAAALKTLYAKAISEGSITKAKHLQGHLPNGKEARGWIGLRLSKVDQEEVRAAL